jgi:hypothetical protein
MSRCNLNLLFKKPIVFYTDPINIGYAAQKSKIILGFKNKEMYSPKKATNSSTSGSTLKTETAITFFVVKILSVSSSKVLSILFFFPLLFLPISLNTKYTKFKSRLSNKLRNMKIRQKKNVYFLKKES